MTKKLNGAVAKKELVKELEESVKKVETSRFYSTEEGKAILSERAKKLANDRRRAEFAPNQLVWKDVLLYSEDAGEENVATQCSNIIFIGEDFIKIQMMYVKVDDKKEDRYKDMFGEPHFKGEIEEVDFRHLEKHIAKTSGNVWWKVK